MDILFPPMAPVDPGRRANRERAGVVWTDERASARNEHSGARREDGASKAREPPRGARPWEERGHGKSAAIQRSTISYAPGSSIASTERGMNLMRTS
jgi:hypothetical protein